MCRVITVILWHSIIRPTLDSQVDRAQVRPSDTESSPGSIALREALVTASREFFEGSRAFHEKENSYVPTVLEFFGQVFGGDNLKAGMYCDEVVRESDISSKGSEEETISKRLAKKGIIKVDAARKNYVAMVIKNEYGISGDALLKALVWHAKHCEYLKVYNHPSSYNAKN